MSDSISPDGANGSDLASRQFQQGKYTYKTAASLCLAGIVRHATALQRSLDNGDEALSHTNTGPAPNTTNTPQHQCFTPPPTTATAIDLPLIPTSPLTRQLLESRTALSTTLTKISSLSSRASGTTHRRLLEDRSVYTSRISILEARIEKAEGLAWGKVDTEGVVLGMLRIWEKCGDEERKRDWVWYVRGWVPHAIVLAANASREKGVAAIERVVQVSEVLTGQGEETLADAVLDALHSEVVKALEPMWKALPKKLVKRLDDLKKGKGKTSASHNLDTGRRRTQEDEEVEHWLLTRAYIPEYSPAALTSEDTTQSETPEAGPVSMPMTPTLGSSDKIAQTATDDALDRLGAIVAKLRTPSRLYVDHEQGQEHGTEMEAYAFPSAPTTALRIAMEEAQASFDSNAGLFEQSPERWLGEANTDSGSGSGGEEAEDVEWLVREAEAEAEEEEQSQGSDSDSDDEDGDEEMKKFREDTKRRIAKAVKDMRKQNAHEDASDVAARELIPEDVRDETEAAPVAVDETAVDDVIGRAMQELHMEDTNISSVIGGTIPRVLSLSDLPAAGGADSESESPPDVAQNYTSLEGVKDGVLIASESRAVTGQGESSLTKVENRRLGNVTITMGEDTKGKSDLGSSVRVREDNDERESYDREREAAAKVGVPEEEEGKARIEEGRDQPGKAEEKRSLEGPEEPETRRPLTMENRPVEKQVFDETVSDDMAQESDTADPALSSGDGDEALKEGCAQEAPSLVKLEGNRRRGKGKRGKGNRRGR